MRIGLDVAPVTVIFGAEAKIPEQDFTVDLRRFAAIPADHVRAAFTP